MHSSIKHYTRAALMTALCAVLSLITIPIGPVPITLQTFAVALAGAVLGARFGTLSIGAYLLLGAAGVPVFSGMRAGAVQLVGPTGGFLFGFLAMAALCGLARDRGLMVKIVLPAAGLLIVYAAGAAQFAMVTGRTLFDALAVAVFPFVAKDIISVGLAMALASTLLRALNRSG